ncbi:MAG TPA: SDR family NAD(P)-dependent oxidoreductase, partial [Candidatus Limnocylindria bacterium]|nr:SDR family NAD(P)-dependent oxidoreductase [Candidatus Limnocylindria bacterium]
MSGRLEAKVCLITGAGSGIGRASARLFAREGGCVIVADVDRPGADETAKQIHAEGGTANTVIADVADP